MQKITFSSPPGPEETITQATQFFKEVYGESSAYNLRLQQVLEEIRTTGTYRHTFEELEFGARVAWRNSNRCIGRLFWESLEVMDCRVLKTDEEIRNQIENHLKTATNGGKIIPTISIFEGGSPDESPPLKFLSPQWIRYAGYLKDGIQKGDPLMNELTEFLQKSGWTGEGTDFDLLPVVYQKRDEKPVWFELDKHLVMEVTIQHPDFPWIQEQGWKWHAVPLISNMGLYIGGVYYAAAPFNGWYMLTEIAVRNLADQNRYNLLPKIAEGLKLDTSTYKNLWKDRAMLILMEAVRYSYEKAGVVLVDHHRADYQFQTFLKNEAKAGRDVNGDWAWLVPPTAGSLTQVFHCEMSNKIVCPNFFYQE